MGVGLPQFVICDRRAAAYEPSGHPLTDTHPWLHPPGVAIQNNYVVLKVVIPMRVLEVVVVPCPCREDCFDPWDYR